MVDKIRIPMYESLITTKKRMKGSFHALPIQNINYDNDTILENGFLLALENSRKLELSITGPFFDSLSDPTRVIEESSNIMREIYNSDQSLFVTCGSTMANKIVIDGVCKAGDKILCQSGVHQSIYFSLMNTCGNIDFINDIACEYDASLYRANAEELLLSLKNNSYKTLIINSQTYDGVCFDLSKFLDHVCTISNNLENIIIDEAWGAWSTFASFMREKSAVLNAKRLSKKYDINFIVVHSIHKSLFSFRQSSLINVYGDDNCQSKIISSHFKNHTTSPSYPILASTELAIIHASNFGCKYSDRSLYLVNKFKRFINTLTYFECKDNLIDNPYFFNDPTKIWIYCNSSLYNGEKLRIKLFNNQGVYISRYSDNAILLNFHYGITEGILNILEDGLKNIEKNIKLKNESLNISIGDTSDSFFILYPPGIPVITPGQKVSEAEITQIKQSQLNNISLLVVEGN